MPATRVAFEFLANLGNWPRWAIDNVNPRAVPTIPTDGIWSLRAGQLSSECGQTPATAFLITISSTIGELEGASIANGAGTEFMFTFFQPPGFTDAFFDEQMKLVDIELAKLKELVEATP